MAAARKPDEATSKAAAYGGIILAALEKLASAVFSLSVHSYFLWSSLLFAGCGIALTITGPQVNTFLCQKPTQEAEGGPGCEFCRADILMCPKDQCYQDAVNITWQTTANTPDRSRYQAFMQAATDITCNTLLEKRAQSPVEMIVAIHNSGASTVTAGCIRFHCGVLKSALGDNTDMATASGVCTNDVGTKSPINAPACICGHLVKTITASQVVAIEAICGMNVLMRRCPWGDFIPSWCGMTTTTAGAPTTTAAAAGGARSRRLPAAAAAAGALPPPPGALGWMAKEAEAEEAGGCGDAAGVAAAGPAGGNASAARLLQAAAPAPDPSLNDVLEDWTVGAWSKCACYMQCIPGVKTRLVQCLAAKCKTPEPANMLRCKCPHCASCSVVWRMFILSLLFFAQGGIAFIIFLCYLHATTVKAEKMIKISIVQKLLGLVCKNLPPVVRLLVLSNVSFAILIVVQTYASKVFGVAWMTDCFSSADLRLVSLIVAGICLFQLCLGRCAKRLTRKPPWLFVPDRANWPTPIRQIRGLFRALGP